jgi:tetratricopeptide (TPR) repeat protein
VPFFFFDESLGIYTDIADHKGVVQILSNKAAVLIQEGRLKEAAKVLSTAEDTALINKLVYNPLLTNRGILLTKQKDYDRAEKMLETALAKTERANLSEFSTVNFALGKLMIETRRYEEAVGFFETALAVDRASGFYRGIADDLAAIGSANLNLGKKELAADFYKRSIKIYALIENGKKVKDILEKLENLSKTSQADIRVTLHFVNQWIEGENLASPCR